MKTLPILILLPGCVPLRLAPLSDDTVYAPPRLDYTVVAHFTTDAETSAALMEKMNFEFQRQEKAK